ncbi:alpha-2-macroglobulin [Penaeus vannamei]|uniref:TEP1-F n=1 Tax=Penaeus vannamei TaxID=6689 RepID=A0A3R7PBU1_PENVA|nr:alpha-2-macroglobulin [Penaeus vannamei]
MSHFLHRKLPSFHRYFCLMHDHTLPPPPPPSVTTAPPPLYLSPTTQMRISLLSVHADWVRTFCVCLYLLSLPAGDGGGSSREEWSRDKGERENEINRGQRDKAQSRGRCGASARGLSSAGRPDPGDAGRPRPPIHLLPFPWVHFISYRSLPFPSGVYFITTPGYWRQDDTNQVCVHVSESSSPEGSLLVQLIPKEWSKNVSEPIADFTFSVPAGKGVTCREVVTGETEAYSGHLTMTGSVEGSDVSVEDVIRFLKRSTKKTFIQTDKYLYRPGHDVQFRILSLEGPLLRISTREYDEVWITTPSDIRIAQWKNVDNANGLVHLSMTLADEPEHGTYRIFVRKQDCTDSTTFKVEDYVLPRFEVTLTPPKYILATDDTIKYTVCAKYTFGQPVRGEATLIVNNEESGLCRTRVNKTLPISGCQDFELTSEELQIQDCNVYRLNAEVEVKEKGTEVTAQDISFTSVTRKAVKFQAVYKETYKKPNLPYKIKVRATLPDESPAAGVPVEVCAAGKCANLTTAEDGLITAVVMSDKANRIFMSTLNCRAGMHSDVYSQDLEHYFSPSNSSLLIYAPEGRLKCVSGQGVQHDLQLLFSATNQVKGTLKIMVISRGRMQKWWEEEVEFTQGPLPVDAEHLVDAPSTPTPPTITGVVNLSVTLPPTASPKAKLLIWYTREDGEVVSDTRELEVERCTTSKSSLTWSAAEGEPGEEVKLALVGEPDAVCSLGVVDRSVELASQEPDPLTLDTLFNYVADFEVGETRAQLDTHEYCLKKLEEERAAAAEETMKEGYVMHNYAWYTSPYVDALWMFAVSI